MFFTAIENNFSLEISRKIGHIKKVLYLDLTLSVDPSCYIALSSSHAFKDFFFFSHIKHALRNVHTAGRDKRFR